MLYVILLILICVAIMSLTSAVNRQTRIIQKAADESAREKHVEKFGSIDAEVVALAERGETIQAIKLYRQRTGCDLKIAKERIEELMQKETLGPKKENPRDLYGF